MNIKARITSFIFAALGIFFICFSMTAKANERCQSLFSIADTLFPVLKSVEIVEGTNYVKAVLTNNDGTTDQVSMAITGRNRFQIVDRFAFLPAHWLDFAKLKGQKVLDAGCGEGVLVEEMRANGINAVGLDLHLSDRQIKSDHYFHGSMTDPSIPMDSFDAIFSTASYPSQRSYHLKITQQIINNLLRIVRKNGHIILSPVDKATVEKAILNNPKIEIVESGSVPGIIREDWGKDFVVLRRIL